MTTKTVPSVHTARRGGAVTLIAVAAAVIVWAIGRAALGHDPTAADMSVGGPQVVAASAVTGVAAWLTSKLLDGRGDHGLLIWRVLAISVSLLSLLGPTLRGGGSGSMVVLAGLHLAVGVVLVAGFGREPAEADQQRLPEAN